MSEELKHIRIAVARIHPNPRRNFQRNPINPKQVDKIIESIGRTGFWDNVVVRPHPQIPGEYQLAYGHSRLEAVKRVGLTEVTLPVMELTDYDMQLAMMDENETQQAITTAIAFENVETSVELLEWAFNRIGPEGTYKAFNEVMGRSRVVPRGTTRHHNDHGFEQAREAFFRGEGIGRRFLSEIIPRTTIHQNIVNEVLNAHYGPQRAELQQQKAEADQAEAEAERKKAEAEKKTAEASEKAAEAQRKKAEEQRKKAEAEKREAEAEEERKKAEEEQAKAERLQKESEDARKKAEEARKKAEEAEEKARKTRAEAKRIAGRIMDDKILMEFKQPRLMEAFAKAISDNKIPKSHHRAAMEYARLKDDKKTPCTVRTMNQELRKWWYRESGQEQRDYERSKKEQAFQRFEKISKEGVNSFLGALGEKARGVSSDIELFLPTAPYVSSADHFQAFILVLETARDRIDQLVAILKPKANSDVIIDAEAQMSEGSDSSHALGNGSKALPFHL